MKLTLEALRIIDSIDRNPSFALAAKEVNKVPSALSYTVKKLESDLGIALFNRDHYRVTLTEAGQILLKRGRILLEEARELELALQSGRQPEPMTINVALDDLFSFEFFVPVLNQFLEEHPHTLINCSTEVLNGSWDALREGRADVILAATSQPELNINVIAENLGFIPHVFAVASFHPLAQYPEPLTTQQIQGYRLIYVSDTAQRMTKTSSGYIHKDKALYVPNVNAKLHSQLKGLGVGFLPKYLAHPYVKSGQLIEKRVSHPKQPSRLVVAVLETNVSQKINKLKSLIYNSSFDCLE